MLFSLVIWDHLLPTRDKWEPVIIWHGTGIVSVREFGSPCFLYVFWTQARGQINTLLYLPKNQRITTCFVWGNVWDEYRFTSAIIIEK